MWNFGREEVVDVDIHEQMEALKQDIESETDRIWMEEPEEIKKLRMGFIDSGAGSYGQYFTTLVFVDGEVRALGYLCYTGILNAIDDPNFELSHIQKLANILLPVCSEFLGYCGLKKVSEFSQRFLDLMNRVETKDGLHELVRSLVLYVNRMHGWIHFYLPWSIGSECRLKTLNDIDDLKLLIKKREEDC